MEPDFRVGDTILIDPSTKPLPGEPVVAVDQEGHSYFRNYREVGTYSDGRKVFELVPLNTFYGVVRSDAVGAVIVGTVVEHRRNPLRRRR
jgi:SOS-response transcriptional repressor LexA